MSSSVEEAKEAARSQDAEASLLEEVSSDSIEHAEEDAAGMESNEPLEQELEELESSEEPHFVEHEDSIQIAASKIPVERDPMLFIQLGDRIYLQSMYGQTIGTVYYRSNELIRVRPDHLIRSRSDDTSTILYDFAMKETDEGEEFDESLRVTEAYLIEKRTNVSFVEQHELRVNQEIKTFLKDGTPYEEFQIVEVNEEKDAFTIQRDDEEPEVITCGFEGIPLDAPFSIIQRSSPSEPLPADADWSDEAKYAEQQDEELEEGLVDVTDEPEEEEAEILGVVQITRTNVYEEAESYEQRIPEEIQRISALNDFISGLDPSLQKDPYALRYIRIQIETLWQMQQSIMKYNAAGQLEGVADTSVSTLMELMKQNTIPLGRPVLRISKKEYSTGQEEEKESDEVWFEDFKSELEQMNNTFSKMVSDKVIGAKESSNKLWNMVRSFLEQYGAPWKSSPKTHQIWKALSDTDVFRMSAPETVDDVQQFTLPGYTPSHSEKVAPIFYRVPFGIERALSTTYRKGKDRRKETWMAEEDASLQSYIIFPPSVTPYLGSSRSYHLAVDSGRSQLPPKTMKMLLREIGVPVEPQEESGPQNAILFEMKPSSLHSIPIETYLDRFAIPSVGMGDAMPLLAQFGLDQSELTENIYSVLQTKIAGYQSHFTNVINQLRSSLTEKPPAPAELNPFIIEPAFLKDIAAGQPMLADELKYYEETNVSLAASDIGKVAHLMKHHAHYFQAAAGKDSKRTLLAYHSAMKDQYMERLRVRHLLSKNEESSARPTKNACRHVSDLVSVRKIRNDAERFQALIRVFRTYQGAKDQNWINCNVCEEHFLCLHERLQLRAYMNPKEKGIIEKELILTFSGGQFQGKYICRNCGQVMRDLDFDQNIEFDDNGRPKSGNAVLVDKEADFEENLNVILQESEEPSLKESLDLSPREIEYFDVVFRIATLAGITLQPKEYQNIIRSVSLQYSKFASEADYNAAIAASSERHPPYLQAKSREMISDAAVFLLLEIQSAIPSYLLRYPMAGCASPGFGGMPLEEEGNQGIKYIACVVSIIQDEEESVWSRAFQKEGDVERRRGIIEKCMNRVLSRVVKHDVVQSKLSQKRMYLAKRSEEMVGGKDNHKDMIPATFLPEPLILTAEDAARDVIQPEVVAQMGKEGYRILSRLWIRQAHRMARETAILMKSSYSETSCCVHPLVEPGKFWKEHGELPSIPLRTFVSNRQGTFLLTEFHTREMESSVTKPNEDLYYRLFLKYCFKGENEGYPHQIGLTNECMWCGLQYPSHPSVMDINTEGRQILQDVNTGTEEFMDLLDKIHTNNHVDVHPVIIPPAIRVMMESLSTMEPAPIPNWKQELAGIMQGISRENILKLARPEETLSQIERREIANIAVPLSSNIQPFMESVFATLARQTGTLTDITKLSWSKFCQVLQSYFVIPFQRMISNFAGESLFIPIELQKTLAPTHLEQYLKPIMNKEVSITEAKRVYVNKTTVVEESKVKTGKKKSFLLAARTKMEYFLSQLSAVLPFMNQIRPHQIPGGSIILQSIQRAILYGPLATLLNRISAPSDEQPSMSEMDKSVQFLMEFVEGQLEKFNSESLAYNDAQIKYAIAVRNEMERVSIIKSFDERSEEERQVELINKRLGLGDWAVGGKKAIYAYDKEHFERENRQRAEMGLNEFSGMNDEPVMDDMGFYDSQEDIGYNNQQLNPDDA